MTRIVALLLIATSLHAQDLYAPTRPAMRRGPDLAVATPLSLPDLDTPQRPAMRRDPALVAAIPQPPPQPIVPEGNRGWRPVAQPAHQADPPLQAPASLVQPPPGPVLVANPDAVLVTVSPMSKGASERILGKRLGKIAAVWLVNMENLGSEPVLIAPSAIHRRVAHLEPFDHASMSLLIEDGTRNSFLARAGRAASDVGRGATFMIAFKAIKVGESWPLQALMGADIGIPYLISRLKGAETPVTANFERLAWTAPIQIGPGESVVAHLFAAQWDNPSPVSFSIDVSRVQFRKSLQ